MGCEDVVHGSMLVKIYRIWKNAEIYRIYRYGNRNENPDSETVCYYKYFSNSTGHFTITVGYCQR